jgi:hypothetical protein
MTGGITQDYGDRGDYCTGPKGEMGLLRIKGPGRIKQD